MKRKRKFVRTKLRGCPRCGGAWTRVVGIVRCVKCAHEYGSQNPSELDFYARGAFQTSGRVRARIADEEPRSIGDKRGRQDTRLNFKE